MKSEKKQTDWRYYNQAVLPSTPPHITPDLSPIKDGTIWSLDGKKPLFARWTSDFDCGHETGWWHLIKDTPFDVMSLKSGYRYKINKGSKYFDCKIIEPTQYVRELYEVLETAILSYPHQNHFSINFDDFAKCVEKDWGQQDVVKIYAAFYRETKRLCGYCVVLMHDDYANLSVVKANPDYEKYQINAAMINKILTDLKSKLSGNFYITDGERNVLHETAFQDYLEKYFGFRKAYCKLNIKYRPGIDNIVKMLYFFNNFFFFLEKHTENSFICKISSVLFMEKICRNV